MGQTLPTSSPAKTQKESRAQVNDEQQIRSPREPQAPLCSRQLKVERVARK